LYEASSRAVDEPASIKSEGVPIAQAASGWLPA